MEKGKKRSDCPLSCSLDVFGDKWSLLIIRDLVIYDKNTYGDFLKSDERIATNILASRLQTLEENGIIKKFPHPDSKAKVLYALTQKGIDLLPVLLEIYIWADKHSKIPDEIQEKIRQARKDKGTYVEEISRQLKQQLALFEKQAALLTAGTST